MTDLNYLYHRRGESLIRAAAAADEAAQRAHATLAGLYAQRIRRLRDGRRPGTAGVGTEAAHAR
jgi:hypothetical protein